MILYFEVIGCYIEVSFEDDLDFVILGDEGLWYGGVVFFIDRGWVDYMIV